jgi:polyisoprenoid-binding protein YceI
MPTVGPADGSLVVKTYREGVAAKVGHDLVIDVTEWQASLEGERVEFTADPRSLRVREGLRGVKPLTDKDRDDIRKTIEEKVLGGKPITFSGIATRQDDGMLVIDGDLTLAGTTRAALINVGDEAGRAKTTHTIKQTDWGIKPYRGLMGALKVRDDVEVVLDVALPAA